MVSGPAGLAAGDEIEGTPKALNDAMSAGRPGDKFKLHIRRNGAEQEVEVTLEKNVKRTFAIQPLPNSGALRISDPARLAALARPAGRLPGH